MISNIKSLFILIRPLNAAITFAAVIVASFISANNPLPIIEVLIAGIAAFTTAAAGNVINDVVDYEADKINHPKRILPSGKLKISYAKYFYALLVIVSIVLSAFVNYEAITIVIAANVLLLVYSISLKRKPLIGNFTVSLLTGLVFFYGAVVVNNPTAGLIPAIFAILINMIRELVKDMEDVEGDKNFSVLTFPVKYGFKKTNYLILIITMLLIFSTVIPFILKIYNIEFFIIAMVIINPILIYCIKKLFEHDSINNLRRVSSIIKINMVIGLAAIYLGK